MKVENKYNLTYSDIENLFVKNRQLICEPTFVYDKTMRSWSIMKSTLEKVDKYENGFNSFEINIYDQNVRIDNHFKFHLYRDKLMCGYVFEEFFQPEDIKFTEDLKIQEMFLKQINELIDDGILSK